MRRLPPRAIVSLLLAAGYCRAQEQYVGPQRCGLCHIAIARAQERTAMAKTWRGEDAPALPANIDGTIFRRAKGFAYSPPVPQGTRPTFPIEVIMGGERHGLGFLARVEQIAGQGLERPALVQARYFFSFKNGGGLVPAPGLPAEAPRSYESALGLTLSPSFEKQCLMCHGAPHTAGAGEQGGVHCESCHGPGSEHVAAASAGRGQHGIINPRRLAADDAIEVCAPCHAGSGRHIDPSPDDLLIANQVNALRTSECFVQSGRAFSCTSCHDPHKDSHDETATIRTCLGCHGAGVARRAGICPVNATTGCVGCHMPAVDVGPLHLVDHQIRVHPEQHISAQDHEASLGSQVEPVKEFLRIVKNGEREKIVEAQRRIAGGDSFYDVARALSSDGTASIGGFWGEREVAKLDPALIPAAVKLRYGERSGVTAAGGEWYLMERMPRDFKWQAGQIEQAAEGLVARGDLAGAIEKSQEALHLYPHFRRALTFLGTTLAQGGSMERAANVLGVASRLYPEDAVPLFARGVVLGELNRREEEIGEYRRVLQMEPDFLAAYAKLGSALARAGDQGGAITVFRAGLQIDPLSAELYHELSAVLAQRGENKEAQRYAALAGALDKQYSAP